MDSPNFRQPMARHSELDIVVRDQHKVVSRVIVVRMPCLFGLRHDRLGAEMVCFGIA